MKLPTQLLLREGILGQTSKWFRSLTSAERKDLVCMLFEVRREYEGHVKYPLFLELLRTLDDEYHSLK